jgi:predicted GIY-YIG superfamily endonuclease
MTDVYLIESTHYQGHHYVGITDDLKQRFIDHNAGRSSHTRKFKPWRLISYTALAAQKVAGEFESYLKTGSGKAFLRHHFLGLPRKRPL